MALKIVWKQEIKWANQETNDLLLIHTHRNPEILEPITLTLVYVRVQARWNIFTNIRKVGFHCLGEQNASRYTARLQHSAMRV